MIVKKGDQGEFVKKIQRQLNALNYNVGEINGKFDTQTEKAVRDFQNDQALEVDGIVGPITAEALLAAVDPESIRPRPTKLYINKVMFEGLEVYDQLDALIAAVSAGEGNRFDLLNKDVDGEGLSFGYIQWCQNKGSLYGLLKAMDRADHDKFVEFLGDGSEEAADELLQATKNGGKQLPLWESPWAERFLQAGRDIAFQRVQREEARKLIMTNLKRAYDRYPEQFKPQGKISLRAMVMMADVGNQAGPNGLLKAIEYANENAASSDEADFIEKIGVYVENRIARKYGYPNYGATQERHQKIIYDYALTEKLDWPELGTILV